MNPIHVEYLTSILALKIATLLEITDRLDPKKRDEAMMYAFMQFAQIEIEPDADEDERLGDVMTDYANYSRFKAECQKLPGIPSDILVIQGIVSITLAYCYGRADMDKARVLQQQTDILERTKEWMSEATDKGDFDSASELIEMTRRKIANIDTEIRDAKELYAYICENLVQPLIDAWKKRKKDALGDTAE
jgi:hypothetical protein